MWVVGFFSTILSGVAAIFVSGGAAKCFLFQAQTRTQPHAGTPRVCKPSRRQKVLAFVLCCSEVRLCSRKYFSF